MSDKIYLWASYYSFPDEKFPKFKIGDKFISGLLFNPAKLYYKSKTSKIEMLEKRDKFYELTGKVEFASNEFWVLNFGFLAIQNTRPHDIIKAGDSTRIRSALGIETNIDLLRAWEKKSGKKLIYTWKINKIFSKVKSKFVEMNQISDENATGICLLVEKIE